MNVGFGGKADIAIEIQKCPLMTQSGLTEQYGLLAVQWLSKRQIPVSSNLTTHSAAARMLAL
jgi:hypothetical protein